jgi:hypothetical protein
MLYGLGYICIYLLLTFDYRRIVDAPDLSLKVSALITPIVASLTLFLSILIIRKYLSPFLAEGRPGFWKNPPTSP